MDIKEINDVSISNSNTSDELNIVDQDTNYAKRKRTSKIVNISIITISSLAALLVGGSLISNAFIKDPIISVSKYDKYYQLEGLKLNYSFVVKNESDLSFIMKIEENNNIIYTLDVRKALEYEGSVDLKINTDYKIYFNATNNFDYSRTLYQESFIINE